MKTINYICLFLVLGFITTGEIWSAVEAPNFIVLLVDDLRWDEIGAAGYPFDPTPNVDRLAREGIIFRNAFSTTPLCSPSRASFLSGLYAHSHGIIDNTDRSAQSHKLQTFPQSLQQAGYVTGFVGKWHMGNDASPRPGFDYWVAVSGQGTSIDPVLNINHEQRPVKGYTTDILTDLAIEFLEKHGSKPFLLYLSHKALHPDLIQYADGSISDPTASKFIPAQRHEHLYENMPVPRRPSAFRKPVGKPALLRKIGDLPPLGKETATGDKTIRDRLRMLKAVDESLGRILQRLQRSETLDQTMIIFTSDHGYFYGEHGLSVERRLAYEEAIRIPLVMRYPARIRAGTERKQMVLNIDLAPTVLEVAGIKSEFKHQGRSLMPLFEQDANTWRSSFLIEYYTDTVFPRVLQMGYRAVRTPLLKYIDYLELENADELYNLQKDPYERANIIGDPSAQDDLKKMQAELKKLLQETGAPASRPGKPAE